VPDDSHTGNGKEGEYEEEEQEIQFICFPLTVLTFISLILVQSYSEKGGELHTLSIHQSHIQTCAFSRQTNKQTSNAHTITNNQVNAHTITNKQANKQSQPPQFPHPIPVYLPRARPVTPAPPPSPPRSSTAASCQPPRALPLRTGCLGSDRLLRPNPPVRAAVGGVGMVVVVVVVVVVVAAAVG